jgi:hypothetical protein
MWLEGQLCAAKRQEVDGLSSQSNKILAFKRHEIGCTTRVFTLQKISF